MEIFWGILIILSVLIGFYLGKHGDLNVKSGVKVLEKIMPKPYGKVVIDIDEVEVEKKDKKREKEIIDIKDAIEYYDNDNG